jgi:hypothetical protein
MYDDSYDYGNDYGNDYEQDNFNYGGMEGLNLSEAASLLPGVRDVEHDLNNVQSRFNEFSETVDTQLDDLYSNYAEVVSTLDSVIDLTNDEERQILSVNSTLATVYNETAQSIEKIGDFMESQDGRIQSIIEDVNALKNYDARENALEVYIANTRLKAEQIQLVADSVDMIPVIGGDLASGGRYIARGMNIAADMAESTTASTILQGLMSGWKQLTGKKFSFSSILDVISGNETSVKEAIDKVKDHLSNIAKLTVHSFRQTMSGKQAPHRAEIYFDPSMAANDITSIGMMSDVIGIFLTDSATGASAKILVRKLANNRCMVGCTLRWISNDGVEHVEGENPDLNNLVPKPISSEVFAPQLYAFGQAISDMARNRALMSYKDVCHTIVRFITRAEVPVILSQERAKIMEVTTKGDNVHQQIYVHALMKIDDHIRTMRNDKKGSASRMAITSVRPTKGTSLIQSDAIGGLKTFNIIMPAHMRNANAQVNLRFTDVGCSELKFLSKATTIGKRQFKNFYYTSRDSQKVLITSPATHFVADLDINSPFLTVYTSALHANVGFESVD